MSVRIVLDEPENRCYTNLDFITGSIHLVLPSDTAIAAINVKLEGESRTRLTAPKFPGNERSDKKRVELELHKVRGTELQDMPCVLTIIDNSCCTKS